MSNENTELNDILKQAGDRPSYPTQNHSVASVHHVDMCGDECDGDTDRGKLVQFTTGDGIKFFPAGRTVDLITPGVYEIRVAPQVGLYYEKVPVKTEGLIRFPETNSDRVINEIMDFWNKEDLYRHYCLAYKRGMILWGPPGTGKSLQ